MNRPIRGVAVVSLLMMLALMLNLSVAYVAQTDYFYNRPENRRVTDARFGQDRGAIMVGNTPIAKSSEVSDRFLFQRSYPSGELYAPVTGYYAYLYGASGLEGSYSAELAGQDNSQFLSRLINLASGARPKGGTVETTISAKAQKAAWKALDGRKGAVVAIDYKTGAIKALVTSPSYDPNKLATHDLVDSTKAWNQLTTDADKPMANRATKEIYPPGSTFKLVTTAAALENGASPEDSIDGSSYKLPGSTKVINACAGGKITLAQALKVSCNPAFARLGVAVGDAALREQAEKFGFGSKYLPEIGSAASRFPDELDPAQTAMSAIGEFEVAASPLQMAMVSAAIANDGVAMEPYLVQRVLDSDLRVVSQTSPRKRTQAVSATTAGQLKQMMVQVVEGGTGYRAQIPGVTVGGKTGTANSDNKRRPYAWFTAWADDPSVAVCVFVEDAEMASSEIAGGRVSAPIAKAVIEALR
ncbi:penicillin-binding protein 2 [Propionicimonas sp.]|uniref:peptidoglycan D,D-transpeptidase FtsI family protein n=1 Tax=Propionicimonas sp. TaxID=1955623 RepID=UPI00185AEFF7|nr:penicillin-binding protein 2 [Propionicimonas sp.]MBU3976803.1 penicillin-binding protein 2 [Actinomycetota bacterium]MBA3019492.1 penicillin-binding protein 2 [Propionicimonas sp.]MBU3986898.1 penicillin-binding protein 2 [Actinomycetota bacterium]MBU4006810.1 penicillin-binding protein 2 [Actinomycetota bacterium]MBU4065510.1 penicillin-binding protein 2 [Actinomycetota bacterium]